MLDMETGISPKGYKCFSRSAGIIDCSKIFIETS